MSSFQEIISGESPTLVDMFATWCGPCKAMHPVLQQLKSRMGDRLTIVKVDIDNNPSVAARYGVQAVPTLLLFKAGEVIWRQSGAMPVDTLEQSIKQALNWQ